MGTFKKKDLYTQEIQERRRYAQPEKRAIYRYHIHVRTDIMAQFISELPTGKCVNPLKI